MANDANLFNGNGKLGIISNNGLIAGLTGKDELLGKKADAIYSGFSSYMDKLTKGETLIITENGVTNVFVPVNFGRTNTPWVVNVSVPEKVITGQATIEGLKIAGIGLFLLLIVWICFFLLSGKITKPIKTIATGAKLLAEGDTSLSGLDKIEMDMVKNLENELGEVGKSFASLSVYISNLSEAAIKTGNGDFDFNLIPQGEKDELTRSMMAMRDSLIKNKEDIEALMYSNESAISENKKTITELNKTINAISEGKLSSRVDTGDSGGENRQLREGVNSMLDAVIEPLMLVSEYMERIGRGDIPPEIKKDYRGDFGIIESNLNLSIKAINRMIEDSKKLSEYAKEGNLDERTDISKHKGDFRQIIASVNDTLYSLTMPLNEAMNVMKDMAEKDLTSRIRGSYKGKLSEFSGYINTALENLENAMQQIAEGADSVYGASQDISSDSQKMAIATANQSEALSGITESVDKLSKITRTNTENADIARSFSKTAS
jgi:methyl-accepting chemotaxis protein